MITSGVEAITPAIAAAILEGNVDNRKPRPAIVTQYAADMMGGRWKVNGAAIVIDDAGNLNDGQHRLMAIVESGVTVQSLVVRGVERSTRDTVDIHAARIAGDILQMFHIPNGNSVAAIARAVLAWERSGKKTAGSTNNIGKSEVLARAMNDARLLYADKGAETVKHIARRTSAGFCRYAIPDCAPAAVFFERLADGAGLDAGHPVLTLRNWLLRNSKKAAHGPTAEAILRAWCAFRDGRELVRIQIMGELPTP